MAEDNRFENSEAFRKLERRLEKIEERHEDFRFEMLGGGEFGRAGKIEELTRNVDELRRETRESTGALTEMKNAQIVKDAVEAGRQKAWRNFSLSNFALIIAILGGLVGLYTGVLGSG